MPTQYYIQYSYGDEVYTGDVKPGHSSPGFADCSADEYLQSIRDLKQRETYKPRHQPAPEPVVQQPSKPVTRKAARYGPQLPTPAQANKTAQRLEAERKCKMWADQRRLSRQYGWEYYEVVAIAAAAIIDSLGDIPAERWDAAVKQAMETARKHIQSWQEFEVEIYKAKNNEHETSN